MVDRGRQLFPSIHLRFDLRIDISISMRPMITKIWQAVASTRFHLNETNQARAGDVIMLRPRDKLKIYLCC